MLAAVKSWSGLSGLTCSGWQTRQWMSSPFVNNCVEVSFGLFLLCEEERSPHVCIKVMHAFKSSQPWYSRINDHFTRYLIRQNIPYTFSLMCTVWRLMGKNNNSVNFGASKQERRESIWTRSVLLLSWGWNLSWYHVVYRTSDECKEPVLSVVRHSRFTPIKKTSDKWRLWHLRPASKEKKQQQ